jgi:ankyrin repeat protein
MNRITTTPICCIFIAFSPLLFGATKGELAHSAAKHQEQLFESAYSGDYKHFCQSVKALQELRQNPYNLSDARGFKSIHVAAFAGQKRIVKAILRQDPKQINALSQKGHTPLHSAAWYGERAVTKLLLKKGADLSVANIFGRTPLHTAAYRGQTKMVKNFIKKGASLTARTKAQLPYHDNKTALNNAVEAGHHETVAFLERVILKQKKEDPQTACPICLDSITAVQKEERALLSGCCQNFICRNCKAIIEASFKNCPCCRVEW